MCSRGRFYGLLHYICIIPHHASHVLRAYGGLFIMNIQIITEEEYLSQNGACRQNIGDPALHKNRGAMSDKTWSNIVDAQAVKDWELIERRKLLRLEYQQKVAYGELRPPTRTEQLIQIAKGDESLESVQAARRLLAKRNVFT